MIRKTRLQVLVGQNGNRCKVKYYGNFVSNSQETLTEHTNRNKPIDCNSKALITNTRI